MVMIEVHYSLAWWLTAFKTIALVLVAALVYRFLNRPDPYEYFLELGGRSQSFVLVSPVLAIGALVETRWAWAGSAIIVKPEERILWCRKHLGFARTIPFEAIHGLRVHRHHFEYGVTIISPADPPTIPIRLPRGTDHERIERELRRLIGLEP